jgi:hypothetical protein
MSEKERVELVCDACGRRGHTELHSKLAEAVHSRNPQDEITEVLCATCSAAKRDEDSWSMCLGPECD